MTGPVPERVTIPGPVALEAVVEDLSTADTRYGLLCHPHPLYGGTMDNKVVTTAGRALREMGIPTLRFNFRGVGHSTGQFDAGRGETDDAEAAAAWCDARWPGRLPVIAGFSFGAYVALKLAGQRPASHLVTIAPPVTGFDFGALAVPSCPWVIVQGDADEVVSAQRVAAWAGSLAPKPRLVVLPGAGHFFHGRLQDLRDAVMGAIRGD